LLLNFAWQACPDLTRAALSVLHEDSLSGVHGTETLTAWISVTN
jgi:hypothetical protein